MTAYRVTARRSGDWWALEVPDLPGVFSQAKRLDRADAAAREAIALMLDIDSDDVQVAVDPVLPGDADQAVAVADTAREQAEAAATQAQVAMRTAAAILTRTLSQRDAGRVLGVSFQRISQLLKEHADSLAGAAGAESDAGQEDPRCAAAGKGSVKPAKDRTGRGNLVPSPKDRTKGRIQRTQPDRAVSARR